MTPKVAIARSTSDHEVPDEAEGKNGKLRPSIMDSDLDDRIMFSVFDIYLHRRVKKAGTMMQRTNVSIWGR